VLAARRVLAWPGLSPPDEAAPEPQLSVVIPTLGNYAVLKRVLDGFEAQDTSPQSFELIVVADAADPKPEAVDAAIGSRPYRARRFAGAIPGASANRNAGLQAARAPLVLLVDNDTIPTARLVSEHLAWHRDNPATEAGVLGHVRWAPELKVTPFMRWLEHGIQFDYPNIEGLEAGWGRFYTANASVKRGLFERVGGFDALRLPYGYEDLDWALRANREGFRLLYNRDAVVDHLHPMTLDFWRKRVRRTAVSERRFVALHPEVQPWFRNMFTDAVAQPRSRGRGVPLLGKVPRGVPGLGTAVWTSADLYFRQQLAPHFLHAWEQAEAAEPGEDPLSADASGSPGN
jgi:GT2 family glycosyltransferase